MKIQIVVEMLEQYRYEGLWRQTVLINHTYMGERKTSYNDIHNQLMIAGAELVSIKPDIGQEVWTIKK